MAQGFALAKPDTASLKQLEAQGDYVESLTYLYLKANYQPAARDSVSYYTWDKETPCAFTQKFDSGISYKVWNCEEGKGRQETLTIPKMPLTALKRFIETLYYEKDNSWTTPLLYGPEEVGCFYDITEAEQTIRIDIYCGC